MCLIGFCGLTTSIYDDVSRTGFKISVVFTQAELSPSIFPNQHKLDVLDWFKCISDLNVIPLQS